MKPLLAFNAPVSYTVPTCSNHHHQIPPSRPSDSIYRICRPTHGPPKPSHPLHPNSPASASSSFSAAVPSATAARPRKPQRRLHRDLLCLSPIFRFIFVFIIGTHDAYPHMANAPRASVTLLPHAYIHTFLADGMPCPPCMHMYIWYLHTSPGSEQSGMFSSRVCKNCLRT